MLPKTTASHLKSLRAAERAESAGMRTEPHDGRRNAAVFKVGRRMEKWWERETYRMMEGRGGAGGRTVKNQEMIRHLGHEIRRIK